MAAAIGQSLDIPIIIRSLAFQYSRGRDVTIKFDADFLALLDAATQPEDEAAMAPSYFYEWWSALVEPYDNELLNFLTLQDCLEHHHIATGTLGVLPSRIRGERYEWPAEVKRLADVTALPCKGCRLYRAVSGVALEDCQDIRHHVHGLEASYRAREVLTQRRAAGFFHLYQAACAKEAEELASGTHHAYAGSSTRGRADLPIRQQAAKELAKLKAKPNLKWTAGSDLTVEDVLALLHPPSGPRGIHSGYESALPSSSGRQDSPILSSPHIRTQRFSDCGNDVVNPPPLSPQDHPVHFSQPPLRHYYEDPLPTETPPDIANPGSAWLAHPPPGYVPDPPRPSPNVNLPPCPPYMNRIDKVIASLGPSARNATPLVTGESPDLAISSLSHGLRVGAVASVSEPVTSPSLPSVDPAAAFSDSTGADSAMDIDLDAESQASVQAGDVYSDSAGEASDASSMGSVDAAAAYSAAESDPDSDESSLDSVHPGSVYSDSGTASQSDIKSPPSTDPGDALTDNEGELPSDSASLSSVHAGDAFSETSSPPHLSGLSDIEMQDKPNSPAMPPGHVANLSSPESSLAIGSHLHGFETRGPFTASSFADIPTDWLNLDECEEDPDAPENLAPGD